MSVNFLIGRKVGMTRIFNEMGTDFPVTIIKAGPCTITQIKSVDNDGYNAIQMGFEDKANRHIHKPERGHFEKAGMSVKKNLKEYPVTQLNEEVILGQEINSSIFDVGDLVTVSGVSKGKGFAGHMKRHGFSGGRRSHGKNSVMRKHGSVGAGTDPSRIWPGTRMAGRMGNAKTTVKNLEVIQIDEEKNLFFIKGAVPGATNGILYISRR